MKQVVLMMDGEHLLPVPTRIPPYIEMAEVPKVGHILEIDDKSYYVAEVVWPIRSSLGEPRATYCEVHVVPYTPPDEEYYSDEEQTDLYMTVNVVDNDAYIIAMAIALAKTDEDIDWTSLEGEERTRWINLARSAWGAAAMVSAYGHDIPTETAETKPEFKSWFDKQREAEEAQEAQADGPIEIVAPPRYRQDGGPVEFSSEREALDYLLDADFHPGDKYRRNWWADDGGIATMEVNEHSMAKTYIVTTYEEIKDGQ